MSELSRFILFFLRGEGGVLPMRSKFDHCQDLPWEKKKKGARTHCLKNDGSLDERQIPG